MDYFKELLSALKVEREADRNQFATYIQSTSIRERRNNGASWYPIAIRDTEIGRGEYLTIEVERTTHKDIPHQLRFGSSARLFSNHNPEEDFIDGIISWQGGDKLKLALRVDELPDWADNGKLGIDLLFDEYSYKEMEDALIYANKKVNAKEASDLVNVLIGEKSAKFDKYIAYQVETEYLNEGQNEALIKAISANEITVVHGPPGTGKTTTLVKIIKNIIDKEEQKILVTAPSNTAVDLLCEKLVSVGLNVLRIGNPVRVSEELQQLTLDQKMMNHPTMKEIKKLKKQASEFKNLAHKYKRQFGKAEREQRKALFEEAHKIMKDVDRMEQYIINDLVENSHIIAATLVGAAHQSIRHLKYKTLIIDEAGQALEPACWIPILKADKLIMAGDHCQLPPTLKAINEDTKILNKTLLESIVDKIPNAVVMLKEQYRMHENIMKFSSNEFYKDELKAHYSVATQLLYEADIPFQFIDTAGCGFDEKIEEKSISNPEEAKITLQHLVHYLNTVKQNFTTHDFPSIGIIAPYRKQVEEIKNQITHQEELKPYLSRITVNTVDSFQGQERNIIYISMTRSNKDETIGFLSETRRMNVAMTRAKNKLVIVGDSSTLSQFNFYDRMISYAQEINGYASAWEYFEI